MLQAQQSRLFYIHLTVCLSILTFTDLSTKDTMRHSVEGLTKVKNEHALIHITNHVITEGM